MATTADLSTPITDRYPGLRHVMIDFNQMKAFIEDPVILVEGDGVRVRDHTGRWYIDGLAGVATIQLGHANQAVIEAMKSQLDRIALALPLHASNEPELELAELLARITPPELTTARFLSGGSEANETAFKLVRQYHAQTGNPGKYKIISRYRSYHGATMGALAASGGAARKRKFEPFPTGFVHVHPPDCYHCPFKLSYPDCRVLCAELVEEVILGEAAETVAAFITEPVTMSADAFMVPPPEYFQVLRDICDRHNVGLIFDEIITGFGRLGELFGAEVHGVCPDLLTVGKGISSGYAPLAAVVMRETIARAFWGEPEAKVHFDAGHTYSGNPVACAAGLAAVRQIVDGGVLDNVRRQSARLRTRLQDMAQRYQVIGRVDGRGLLLGVEFVTDRETRATFPAERSFCRAVGRAAKQRGLFARVGDHVFVLVPPLVATDGEIDEMADILDAAIAETLETFEWPG